MYVLNSKFNKNKNTTYLPTLNFIKTKTTIYIYTAQMID